MSSIKLRKHDFLCYLCQKDCKKSQKALVIGSGRFMEHICKDCARNNYVIYGTDEVLPSTPIQETYVNIEYSSRNKEII